MSESSFYCISQTGDINCLATVDEALPAVKDGDFLWLDYCQPTKEEVSPLIDRLGTHPLSVEDCIDDSQVPKIEDFPQNYFILFNIFSYSEGELSIGEVDFIIGGKFLVTVSGRDANDRRQINNILRVVKAEIHSARQGPAFLMHVILDFIVDQKFNAANHFSRVIGRYGFMEEPNVPEILALCKPHGLNLREMETSYFLSRENLLPRRGEGMAHWRKQLFAMMSRNASGVVGYFRLAASAVVELGAQVQL